ncbi:response regulator transcription factor [Pseudonocardia sp. C8]|nr:response regulator transcription factor [Pseudonocardia sp. C8]
MVIAGITAMLEPYHQRVEVVATSTTPGDAVPLVTELRPDLVLCDVDPQELAGPGLCRTLADRLPGCRVVLLTDREEERHLFTALRAGAAGYILKSVGGAELVRSLEVVHAGTTVIDPVLAGRTLRRAAQQLSDESWPGMRQGLTHRESEVLSMTVAGLSARGVANRLAVDDRAVGVHLRSIYRKLDVDDRAGAVAAARRTGILV